MKHNHFNATLFAFSSLALIMIQLGLYQHYKGNLYEVIGHARHSETLEELVVYKALYGDYRMWVRPMSMFTEYVDYEGQSVPRFQFKSETLTQLPSLR